jgi:hypothetical protein
MGRQPNGFQFHRQDRRHAEGLSGKSASRAPSPRFTAARSNCSASSSAWAAAARQLAYEDKSYQYGDIAVVGRDVTAAYEGGLPVDVTVASDERVVVIPRKALIAAKPDIPDA